MRVISVSLRRGYRPSVSARLPSACEFASSRTRACAFALAFFVLSIINAHRYGVVSRECNSPGTHFISSIFGNSSSLVSVMCLQLIWCALMLIMRLYHSGLWSVSIGYILRSISLPVYRHARTSLQYVWVGVCIVDEHPKLSRTPIAMHPLCLLRARVLSSVL